jgi:hypothetical protein
MDMTDAVESVATWWRRTAGMASADIDRVTTLLMVYHRTGASDIDGQGSS